MPKTPDEVKMWMGRCANLKCPTHGDKCPWDCGSAKCIGDLLLDGLSRIQQLETENHQLHTKVKQLQAELDKLREKDTPKPCEHKATLYKCLTCPSCGNVVSKHEMWGVTEVRILPDYCQFCGQRIELPKEG